MKPRAIILYTYTPKGIGHSFTHLIDLSTNRLTSCANSGLNQLYVIESDLNCPEVLALKARYPEYFI